MMGITWKRCILALWPLIKQMNSTQVQTCEQDVRQLCTNEKMKPCRKIKYEKEKKKPRNFTVYEGEKNHM